jgi:hypothetical protein
MTTSSSPIPNTVIQDTTLPFRVLGSAQVWGPTGNGRIVPNPGDVVFDSVAGWEFVQSVDPVTLYSTLGPLPTPAQGNTFTQADILLGVGPGTQSESFRIYTNTLTLPHPLAPDGRLHMYSDTIVSYKLFLGTDISSATGVVVSQYYDQSGNFISENIPMQPQQNADGSSNPSIVAPASGATLQSFNDGQVLTAVFYDTNAGPVSMAELMVKNTSYIRQISAAMKYITSIELVSPFLSTTVDNLLQVPINMPMNSLPMLGQVNYSDGTSIQKAIDGTVFQLAGLENFIASTVGQQAPLVLFYTPASNEASYGTTPTPNQKISERYNIQTINVVGSYSVKLVGFPRWVSPSTGYTMEYYLTSLDRDEIYYVTPYVVPNVGSAAFNGLLYGQVQNLTLKLDLSLVDNVVFNEYSFVTTMGVTLLAPGSSQTPPLWTVKYSPNQSPAYGQDLAAVFTYQSVNNWNLDITCGQTSLEQWLNLLYTGVQPLYNPQSETTPPTPNMIGLIFPTGTINIPIAQWNSTIGPIGNSIQQGQLLYIQFFYRDSTGDQQLAVAALPAMIVQPS